jgi:hypothetical protein
VTRAWAWFVMIALVVGLAAPVLAQQAAPAAPAAPATPAPAKTEPAKAAAKAKSATGTVKTATADNLVLVAGKDKKEMSFAVDKDTKITKAGKAATAADLAANDTATVSYTEADGKMTAKAVTVKGKIAAAKPKS